MLSGVHFYIQKLSLEFCQFVFEKLKNAVIDKQSLSDEKANPVNDPNPKKGKIQHKSQFKFRHNRKIDKKSIQNQ